MNKLLTICVLVFGVWQTASADVWKWVDAFGNTHYVSTMQTIYTWVDEFGKVNYSDKPEHADAISVQLMWHSKGSVDEIDEEEEDDSGGYAYPGETAEQRAAREQAQAYYCQRATEIYESYMNAPQMYRTDDSGERQYLSKVDKAQTIADTLKKKNELCK